MHISSPRSASSLHRRVVLAVLSTALLLGSALVPVPAASAAETDITKFYFTANAIDSYPKNSVIRGSGQSVKIASYFKYRYSGTFHKPQVTLQRKINGRWITQASIKPKYTDSFSVAATLPAYTVPASRTRQKVLYRFKSLRSASKGVVNSDYSRAFGITYDNQATYTGLAAQAYAAIAPYCASAAVRVDNSLASSDIEGTFIWSRGIGLSPDIGLYAPEDIAFVALHECAHHRQFYNFGSSDAGEKRAERASKIAFIPDGNPDPAMPTPPFNGRFDPYEHAADCAAQAIGARSLVVGYGGYCNPSELAAGGALMGGRKY